MIIINFICYHIVILIVFSSIVLMLFVRSFMFVLIFGAYHLWPDGPFMPLLHTPFHVFIVFIFLIPPLYVCEQKFNK